MGRKQCTARRSANRQGTDAWGSSCSRRRLAVAVLIATVAMLVGASGAYASELTISNLSPDRYFSPNGDSQDDTANVSYTLSTSATVTILIRDKGGSLVKTVVGGVAEGEGGHSFSWNGRAENNSPSPNGVYKYTIKAVNAAKEEATASGQIGLNRTLPGSVTRPTPEATISGTTSFVFTPTAGENISAVSFYARCPSYPYSCLLGIAITPELDGTYAVESEVSGLSSGANEIATYVSYTDAFGQEHFYSAPVVPVTVAYPEQISNLSPNRYFYPNGSGQEEKASVSYSLSTVAKVTVVLRNTKNEVIRTLLNEAEQGPSYGSFEWDGTDSGAKPAPPGVYNYTITAAGTFGSPAAATGKIGVDRNLPGAVTKPEAGATLTGSETFIFKPTSGENVTYATFYARCPSYPYNCNLGSALGPEPDGTFDVTAEVGNLSSGENEIQTYASFRDPFGQEHSYTAPIVHVTIAYPEQISSVSPDRYFYPNGSGQGEKANVSYSLATAGKVTVVLRNSKNEVVRTLLKEAEQGPGYASFEWDGTDASAKAVPNGVYKFTITAAGNFGTPASANGKIGLDRNLPGTVTKPTSGAALTGTNSFVFTPTPGEAITNVYFYAHCPSYPYYCQIGSTSTPEGDGTFTVSSDVGSLTFGANEVFTSVSFTDPFGEQHGYSAPAVPVTITYPEQISSVSPDQYVYPNAGEKTAYVEYYLSTPAKVTAVLRNAANGVVKELLSETEQQAGYNYVEWDGTDAGAKAVPNGVYTYTISATGNDGPPATASGKIGIDNNIPGEVTAPASEAILSGFEKFVFTPTASENITNVYFYAHCPSYPYTCYLGSSSTPEPDETFAVTADVSGLTAGTNEIVTYVSFTDPYGENHSYSAPVVPVTVDTSSPTITANAKPTDGKAPLKTTFAIEASEPQGHPLSYTINFGDGAAEQTGSVPGSGTLSLEHTYLQAGIDKAAISVFDEHGGFAETTVTVTVSAANSGSPVNELAPAISGTPVEGETLTETHGIWSGEPTSYQLQWLRCGIHGTGCKAVPGQTASTYLLTSADLAHTLEIKEIARNASGPGAPALSNHTDVVTIPKPVNKKPPTIAGPPSEGATLTEEHGEWTGEPIDYEYKWLQCSEAGTGCAPISGETSQTYVTTVHDLGHTIAVEETALNGGGSGEPAVSEPTAPITAAAPVNTGPPSIIGNAENGRTLIEQHGSWRNEPSSYAYKWLRCNSAGNECSTIPGAVDQTYIPSTEDLHHTVKVEEVARNASGSSAPVASAPSPTITSGPLRASAGENISTIAGLTVKLNGSGSSPASDIQSYKWDFGDGSSGEGATLSHTYASPGDYTATLTVTRDTESTSASTKVAVAPAPEHEATILVRDTENNPLSGADVVFVAPGGTRVQSETGSDGKASLPGLPDGTDAVYAYKAGFQPNVGHVTASGGAGETTIALATGEIATSTLRSHEMDLKEIEEAGIDTSDPANQNVWEFEVRLAFIESPKEPVEFHCYINHNGEFVGNCGGGGGGGGGGWGGGGGGGGGGPSCSPGACVGGGVVAVPKIINGHPLIEWLILRGKASVLKQFFTVSMVVQNLSPEPFKLAQGQATLNVPSGISLAPTGTPQTAAQTVPEIPGNGSATTDWIVRGDAPGDYFLSAVYHSQLEPFEAPVDIQAALAQPLHIYGVEALSLKVQADSGKLAEGVPYHVRVGVTNKAEVPLYNVQVEIFSSVHAHFIFQPQQQFSANVSELKPGETVYAPQDILLPDAESVSEFNPSLSSAHFDGEEIHPGEGIEAVKPPRLYGLKAIGDTANVVHLRWTPTPGAEGYEVFDTTSLDTPFASTPDNVFAGGTGKNVTVLPSTETEAYVPAGGNEEPHFYAVTSIVNGVPTLDRPAIAASPGDHSQFPRVTFNTSKINCGTQSGSLGIEVEDPNTIMNSVIVSGLASGTNTIPLPHGIGRAKVSQSVSPADFTSAGASITAQATDALGTGPAVSTTGLCAQNSVLSFGDSVSAGYGLGGSQGYPDNPRAYSQLLAAKLGLQSQNYSHEGECASSKEKRKISSIVNGKTVERPICQGSEPIDVQLKRVPAGLNPQLITVTVGANDIDFGDCLKEVFTKGDVFLTNATNPCNKAHLKDDTDAVAQYLEADLKTMHQSYPSAKIEVMHYYNMFPPAPPSGGGACLLSQAATAQFKHAQGFTWKEVAEIYVAAHGEFMANAEELQGGLYDSAEHVLTELNGAVDRAVAAVPGVVTVPADFSGHDVCAHGSEWVFGPKAGTKLNYLGVSAAIEFKPPEVCPDPVSDAEKPQGKRFSFRVGKGISVQVGYIEPFIAINCLPHPTAPGQEALADAFEGAYLGTVPAVQRKATLRQRPRTAIHRRAPRRRA